MIRQFPGREKFPDTAPRYPNLWILASESLLQKYTFKRSKPVTAGDALTFAVNILTRTAEISFDYGYLNSAEGSDAAARRRGLMSAEVNGVVHDHAVHVRFYLVPLRHEAYEAEGVKYLPACASVHFEADRPDRLHPYVDDCEICGCTGKYSAYDDPRYRNRSSKIKNEMQHDPMGVEAILFGTVNGRKIPLLNSIKTLKDDFDFSILVFEKESLRADMNTANLGVVLFKDAQI